MTCHVSLARPDSEEDAGPRTYDPEFRRRVLELVRAGRPVGVVAAELGLAEGQGSGVLSICPMMRQ